MASSRVWLITGTSSGFGHRLVNIVRSRGDRVIATAKSLTNITHFLEEPRLPSSNVHCAELDISLGAKQVQKRIDTIIHDSGWSGVDVLINNAGFSIPGFVEEGGTELLRSQYQTNVFGTLDVTTAILPYMRKKKSGTIVIIGSRSAWRPGVPGLGFYSSSKAALHAMAETMAVEIEPFGIRVLVVGPGSFRTEGIYRKCFEGVNPIPDYDVHRKTAEMAYRAPAGKQRGDPVKAMKVLVEVICGEGRAQGKAWPSCLVLGQDAERDVRNKCTQMIRHLDEWSDVVRNVELDDLDY